MIMIEENFYTNITGSISHPQLPNITNMIVNVAYKVLNLNFIHIPFDVHPQNLETALRGVSALNLSGISVNSPHQESVIKYLDEINGEASTVGLVNTVVNEGDRLMGYNTNIYAINESLKQYKDELTDNQVTIFGAGSIAKTTLYVLIKHYRPKNIMLFNRNEQRADQMKNFVRDELKFIAIKSFTFNNENIIAHNESSKLLINATPLGTPQKTDETIEKAKSFLKDDQIILDFIYSNTDTKILETAKSMNLKYINGLDVLLKQIAKSFELWTNKNMPIDEVYKIISSTH
jgi:shikimate dehydrogenase